VGKVHHPDHALTIQVGALEIDAQVSDGEGLLYLQVVGAGLRVAQLLAMGARAGDAFVLVVGLAGLQQPIEHVNGWRDDAAIREDRLESHAQPSSRSGSAL
jgi:hypothetical protein